MKYLFLYTNKSYNTSLDYNYTKNKNFQIKILSNMCLRNNLRDH